MKNLKKVLVIALVLFIPFIVNVKAEEKNSTEVKDSKKVIVYVFRGEGCPHCEEALEWFDTLKEDEEYSKYYQLKTLEVWYDEDNASLMSEVAEKLDTEANGVPFIVVGKKYFSGFSSQMEDQIKTAIKDAYNDENYQDVVKAVKKGTYKGEDKKTASALIPIIIVSAVALITVIAMVFFTKEK